MPFIGIYFNDDLFYINTRLISQVSQGEYTYILMIDGSRFPSTDTMEQVMNAIKEAERGESSN